LKNSTSPPDRSAIFKGYHCSDVREEVVKEYRITMTKLLKSRGLPFNEARYMAADIMRDNLNHSLRRIARELNLKNEASVSFVLKRAKELLTDKDFAKKWYSIHERLQNRVSERNGNT